MNNKASLDWHGTRFFTIYHIRSSIPGSDVFYNTYEIYDSESGFLNALKEYLHYAKDCALENNHGYFDDFPWAKEDYDAFLALIDERLTDSPVENELYKKVFEGFDCEIEILTVTSDYLCFFNSLYSDLLERLEIDDIWELDPEERKEIFDLNPIIKYCSMAEASGIKPSEKTLISRFKEMEYEINENAVSLRF